MACRGPPAVGGSAPAGGHAEGKGHRRSKRGRACGTRGRPGGWRGKRREPSRSPRDGGTFWPTSEVESGPRGRRGSHGFLGRRGRRRGGAARRRDAIHAVAQVCRHPLGGGARPRRRRRGGGTGRRGGKVGGGGRKAVSRGGGLIHDLHARRLGGTPQPQRRWPRHTRARGGLGGWPPSRHIGRSCGGHGRWLLSRRPSLWGPPAVPLSADRRDGVRSPLCVRRKHALNVGMQRRTQVGGHGHTGGELGQLGLEAAATKIGRRLGRGRSIQAAPTRGTQEGRGPRVGAGQEAQHSGRTPLPHRQPERVRRCSHHRHGGGGAEPVDVHKIVGVDPRDVRQQRAHAVLTDVTRHPRDIHCLEGGGVDGAAADPAQLRRGCGGAGVGVGVGSNPPPTLSGARSPPASRLPSTPPSSSTSTATRSATVPARRGGTTGRSRRTHPSSTPTTARGAGVPPACSCQPALAAREGG
ncbi:hypothetical protein I4F81_003854 [Pyropia yezoensis]|uniref:Uncharacterized protein n=1 Tax=Pyropia yezoensis TaxID=2788 RepID=A0ACC3BTI4_PYRYE|nr:hypothetical protein I4F81_003854 [Neopyropia yezoensis]